MGFSRGEMFTGIRSVYNLLLIDAINHSQVQLAPPGIGTAHHARAGQAAGGHRQGLLHVPLRPRNLSQEGGSGLRAPTLATLAHSFGDSLFPAEFPKCPTQVKSLTRCLAHIRYFVSTLKKSGVWEALPQNSRTEGEV